MEKTFSIAEAKNHLSSLVHAAEIGESVTLTRRGKPVAVLISEHQYKQLSGQRKGFWQAVETFRQELELTRVNMTEDDLAGLRLKETGRDMHW